MIWVGFWAWFLPWGKGMTKPRMIEPGKTYFVTRRCVGREHVLHPDPEVTAAWRYLMAVACAKFEVQLVAFVVMSNHVHYVVHDPGRSLPNFTAWLHAEVAKAVNDVRGRRGIMWDGDPPNQPVLLDGAAVVQKVAYALANPVAAGLVKYGHQWPGARTGLAEVGGVKEAEAVERPATRYFEASRLPEAATLEYHVPPECAGLGAAGFQAAVQKAEFEAEEAARRARKAAGKGFVGVEGLARMSWKRRAESEEAWGRRNARPKVLGSDAGAREEALRRVALFEAAYAVALAAFREGEREVAFPAGTWAMVERLKAVRGPEPPG